MKWVSIEGVMSSGKSTLAALLQEELGALVVPEPVEEWEKSGILAASYLEPQKYSFPAQLVFSPRELQLLSALFLPLQPLSSFRMVLVFQTRATGTQNSHEEMWSPCFTQHTLTCGRNGRTCFPFVNHISLSIWTLILTSVCVVCAKEIAKQSLV